MEVLNAEWGSVAATRKKMTNNKLIATELWRGSEDLEGEHLLC